MYASSEVDAIEWLQILDWRVKHVREAVLVRLCCGGKCVCDQVLRDKRLCRYLKMARRLGLADIIANEFWGIGK